MQLEQKTVQTYRQLLATLKKAYAYLQCAHSSTQRADARAHAHAHPTHPPHIHPHVCTHRDAYTKKLSPGKLRVFFLTLECSRSPPCLSDSILAASLVPHPISWRPCIVLTVPRTGGQSHTAICAPSFRNELPKQHAPSTVFSSLHKFEGTFLLETTDICKWECCNLWTQLAREMASVQILPTGYPPRWIPQSHRSPLHLANTICKDTMCIDTNPLQSVQRHRQSCSTTPAAKKTAHALRGMER